MGIDQRGGADAALAGFDGAMLQALKETEQALAVYDSELDHHAALAEADDKARRALGMAQGQVEAGAASTLDQLTAEQSLIGADAALATFDAALAQDQIAVFKALGGGWRGAAQTEAR